MASSKSNFSRPNFAQCPLLWLAISYSLGIFLASNCEIDWRIFFGLSVSCAILSLTFINKFHGLLFLFIAFLSSGSFLFQLNEQTQPQNSLKSLYDTKQFISNDPIEIEGVLESKPELAVGGMFFVLNAEKATYKRAEKLVSGRVRFFAPVRDAKIQSEYANLNLRYGDRLRIACNLNREEKFLNPGSVSFKKILAQQDLDAAATVKSPLLIERLESTSQPYLFNSIFEYRQNLIENFRDNFSVGTSGILIASLLGNRHFLTKDTAETFRDGGTFHVLVISGLHITFIGGIILLIVRRFTRQRIWQFAVTSSVLWVYSFAVGAQIPVMRAALMFTILLFSFVIYRKRNLLNALGGCAFLILILQPSALLNQSFQLTFASLVGIIGVAFPLVEKLRAIGSWRPSRKIPFPPAIGKTLRQFCEILYWSELKWKKSLSENLWSCSISKAETAAKLEDIGLQKPLRWIFEGILVTAIVQVFLLPFLVFYFHRISFTSVLLNLWVGLFTVLQNITAIVTIIFAQISGTLAQPLIMLTELFNWLLLFLPRIFISADVASTRIPVYSESFRAIYFLYFVPVVVIVGLVNLWDPFRTESQHNTKSAFPATRVFYISFAAFLFLFCVIVFHPFSTSPADGRLTVEFLDVGQGDSIFVKFPNGRTMLVDGGGKHNFHGNLIERKDGAVEEFEPDIQGIGESVVSEFLWERGYSQIEFLVATHSDADHIQGLASVVKNFGIGAIFIGRETKDREDFGELKSQAARKNLELTQLKSGNTFEIGDVLVEILNPISSKLSSESSNNDSVVIRLTYGAKRFLLTGDIEKSTERELAEKQVLKADIVKVAHHGSRTSSIQEFVNATGADYAVIPVGRRSRFGHPHKEVVERWEKSGARVLTTGEKGTVSISTDGKDIRVQTYLK